MKIILVRSIGGVGERDTVQEVADGYALNALIPQGIAVQATPSRLAELQKRLAEGEAASAVAQAKLAGVIRALNGRRITIKARANAQGHLFKGIAQKDVAHEIGAQCGVTIAAESIQGLNAAMKTTGERKVTLTAAGAEAAVTVSVEAA